MIGSYMIGKYVVVRTYSAGVHAGVLMGRDGREVVLSESRRLWYWHGAKECTEIARAGICHKRSKVPPAVREILLLEAIEVHPTTQVAERSIRECPDWSEVSS
jgi:hypothetical protein